MASLFLLGQAARYELRVARAKCASSDATAGSAREDAALKKRHAFKLAKGLAQRDTDRSPDRKLAKHK